MRHVIIGGVAGGATAAARIRRISENDEIILFEKGEYISYANCGLLTISEVLSPTETNCSFRHLKCSDAGLISMSGLNLK